MQLEYDLRFSRMRFQYFEYGTSGVRGNLLFVTLFHLVAERRAVVSNVFAADSHSETSFRWTATMLPAVRNKFFPSYERMERVHGTSNFNIFKKQ